MTMKQLFAIVVMVSLFLIANGYADAEEILETGETQYVGWEFQDYFLTCAFKKMDKNGAKIVATPLTCKKRAPGPPGFVAGTIISIDGESKELKLKDQNGNDEKIFVPMSERSSLLNAKKGDKIVVEKVENRAQKLDFPESTQMMRAVPNEGVND